MEYQYFPFRVHNFSELNLPIKIFENSRYRFELIKISQDLIDKIFPSEHIIKNEDSFGSYGGFTAFNLKNVYRDILLGHICLKATRKNLTGLKDAEKYRKSLNSVLDLIQLIAGISINEYLSFDLEERFNGSSSYGNNRQIIKLKSTVVLTSIKISQIIENIPKLISNENKKIKLAFELLRNADINGHNSFGLKCSLLVVLIESFVLEGIRSDKDNFKYCLSEYFQTRPLTNYNSLYSKRGIYFHSGEDKFEATDWSLLHDIAKNIICDNLNDPTLFNKKLKEIKSNLNNK